MTGRVRYLDLPTGIYALFAVHRQRHIEIEARLRRALGSQHRYGWTQSWEDIDTCELLLKHDSKLKSKVLIKQTR